MISGNKGMVNSIIKDNKNIIGDNIINVQRTYDLIRILEPLITEDLQALSKELNTSFLGLEYSIKTASSIYDKLERKKEFTEAEKQKLKEDLIKKLKIDLKEKTDEHIRSIVYTILNIFKISIV